MIFLVFVVVVALVIGLMRSLGCVVIVFCMIVSDLCVFVLSVVVRGVHGLFMENAWFSLLSHAHNKDRKK